MKSKVLGFTFALFSILLVCPAINAETIDFNGLAHDEYYVTVNPLTYDGFIFTSSCGYGSDCLGVWGRNDTNQADPGHAAVFVNYGYTTTTMAPVSGGSFDFASIDLADVYNRGVSSRISFTFNYFLGGSSTQEVSLDNVQGLETFTFNQAGLSSVSWVTLDGDNGWGQFDNVVVNEFGSQVPEPTSLFLLGTGLGMVGLAAWRRRK